MDMSKETWKYRGEGNANVVISLPNQKQVLRIAKTCETSKMIKSTESLEPIGFEFYNKIMTRLLGESFASPGQKVVLSNSICMEGKLIQIRPQYRQHKGLQYNASILFKDSAFLPSELKSKLPDFVYSGSEFCVEIKPKQGWMVVADRSNGNCQFCSNQYLKLQKGQVDRRSLYCPMDLFSGCIKRMRKSLKALMESPQNNFKLFKNGDLVYAENDPTEKLHSELSEICPSNATTLTSENIFETIIIQTLLQDYNSGSTCLQCEMFTIEETEEWTQCNFSKSVLPRGCVLERILLLQQLNDGFENYFSCYERLLKENPDSEDYAYIKAFLEETKSLEESRECLMCLIKRCTKQKKNQLCLFPYLLASVAYDCSIMVTFQIVNRRDGVISNKHLIKIGEMHFVVSVSVLDLYPKPLRTINKHKIRNDRINKAVKKLQRQQILL